MDREEEINAAALDSAVRSFPESININTTLILRRAAVFADFIRTGNPR